MLWFYRNITIAMMAAMLLSCGNGEGKGASDDSTDSETPDVAILPMPDVPDSITDPERRAGYAAMRWWDDMDFHNRRLSLDTAFMEQNFSNFLMVVANTDTATMKHAVDRLMNSAEVEPDAWRFLCSIAEKYLYDPNSPFRSDELYIPFLQQTIVSKLASYDQQERDTYRLQMALKNRPGTLATDFSFITREGQNTTLHSLKSDKPVLLMFYNPDCENCEAVISQFSHAGMSQKFTIVAIDAEGDRKRWDETAAAMPQGWIIGYAVTQILDNDLYDLKASPTLYVLDNRKKVLVKDVSPDALLNN